MWVCRAGKDSQYYSLFKEKSRIYIPWTGYKFNFKEYSNFEDFKLAVNREKGTHNQTTISNWASMLNIFVNIMKIGDYVLIPSRHSHTYLFAKIRGNYEYVPQDLLSHSREIMIIREKIPANIFPQTIRFSLGAYRTIFSTKYEDEIIKLIKEYLENCQKI